MTQPTTRRVTAADVARAAGVSRTTVSYVMNQTPNQSIPDSTRDRVLKAVRDLSYIPFSTARALRRGRTDTVMLILPDWPLGRILALIIDSLTEELARQGLSLVTRRERKDRQIANMAQEIQPAALIALGHIPDDQVDSMRATGTYVASALLTSHQSTHDAVVVPQELIGSMQMQHLAFRGHRHVAYISLEDARVDLFRDLRLAGARKTCADLSLKVPVTEQIALTLESAVAAVERLQVLNPRPTGVLAYNDEVAMALLAAMRHLGLEAPTNLAVIGADDEPLAKFAAPPLTSVNQRHEMVAKHLADVVVCGIAGEPEPLSPEGDILELVIRESA